VGGRYWRRLLPALVVLTAMAGAIMAAAVTGTAPGPPDDTTAGTTGERRPACSGIRIAPGDNPHAALTRAAPGATVCFSAGMYRLASPLQPKAGQRLVADRGVVLNGSMPIGSWRADGPVWAATGVLPASPTAHGECVRGYRGCRHAEAVFYDGRPLWRADRRQQVRPGRFYEDYPTSTIWIGDEPRGHMVEVARAEAAVAGTASDVLVDGFVIEKFANPAQAGALQVSGPRWHIERNEIRLNHGHGIQMAADEIRVVQNHIHHNGQLGIGGGPSSGGLVEGNEIDHNNTAGFSIGWEAGGGKWAFTRALTVRRNLVHDNVGAGLWTDTNNVHTTYEKNTVWGNAGTGILHETSFRAVIRDNEVSNNGGRTPTGGWGASGIAVAASLQVEIDHNVVAGNANGIVVAQQVREDGPSDLGPHEVQAIWVHDNDVTMAQGVTGMVNDTGDNRFYGRDIRFEDNRYRLSPQKGRFFAWMDGVWDFATWKQRFGQDRRSQVLASGRPEANGSRG
jgi:hypothetical protein